jgi:hypothetical protein
MSTETPVPNVAYLSQDISEHRLPLQKHMLVASQPRYGEGGEAIAHKASCSPCTLSIFPTNLNVTQLRLANILRPVYTGTASPIHCPYNCKLFAPYCLNNTKIIILEACSFNKNTVWVLTDRRNEMLHTRYETLLSPRYAQSKHVPDLATEGRLP